MKYQSIKINDIKDNNVKIFSLNKNYHRKVYNITKNLKCQINLIHVCETEDGKYGNIGLDIFLDIYKKLKMETVLIANHGKLTNKEKILKHIQLNSIEIDQDIIDRSRWLKFINSDFSTEELVKILPYQHSELEDYIKLLDFDWSKYDSLQQNKKRADSFLLF